MATINDLQTVAHVLVDAPIVGEPRPRKVVEYLTTEGVRAWGVVFDGDPDDMYERPNNPFVRQPHVLQRRMSGTIDDEVGV